MREIGAAVLALAGLWQILPALAWLSSNDLYASGASWLVGGLNYLNVEPLQTASQLLNGAASVETLIGSFPGISIWLGAALLCCALLLIMDPRALEMTSPKRAGSAASASLLS